MRPLTKEIAETLICPIMQGKTQCKAGKCMAWQYTATAVRDGFMGVTPREEDIQNLGECLLIPNEAEE